MKETNDILTLFEALNNHEVFTPPRVAKEMLSLLPDGVWSDPKVKLLDPCTKSGVFLREAFYLFYEGLVGKGRHTGHDGVSYNLNNHQERINHIFKNMLYGIATSELTGFVARRTLYGVMKANTDKELAAVESFESSSNFSDWSEKEKLNFIGRNQFNKYYNYKLFNTKEYKEFEQEGNVFYPASEVQKIILEEDDYEVEDTYFPFIDKRTQHEKILEIKESKMKFDVIIGNPPYQTSDGGHGDSASPIYHKFIQQAKKMDPKYLSFIVPARWYSGGKGLDTFRNEMLDDNRISELHDFPETEDCFPGLNIRGGVCYFLWNNKHSGNCNILNHSSDKITSEMKRPLREKGSDFFIRYNKAIKILRKVQIKKELPFVELVSSRKPFGLSTNFKDFSKNRNQDSVKLYRFGENGYVKKSQVIKNKDLINNYKIFIAKASPGGDSYPHQVFSQPIAAGKNTCCTETYICIGPLKSKVEADNIGTYICTQFFRFLVILIKNTQDVPKKVYSFVPVQDFSKKWTDAELYKRYNINTDEQEFISELVRPMSYDSNK